VEFLHNGYLVFPGGRGGRGVELIPPSHLAITLLTLRAFLAYKKGENLPVLWDDE